jgi:hypothetical protein
MKSNVSATSSGVPQFPFTAKSTMATKPSTIICARGRSNMRTHHRCLFNKLAAVVTTTSTSRTHANVCMGQRCATSALGP